MLLFCPAKWLFNNHIKNILGMVWKSTNYMLIVWISETKMGNLWSLKDPMSENKSGLELWKTYINTVSIAYITVLRLISKFGCLNSLNSHCPDKWDKNG